ncbi:hypothetical protein Snas_0232 [Stackebrandtia nassauensis DSM 44728]|uniref:Uncharacterized protein n=1 Tax=Stackebrandtia nassauensis (strain DSM 44728 / CIP 108903 / NRRL B-16338 / NBRC 102104 / LLR-40K-21) TaxID=446470 RepID=D3Q2Y1_STANL|nr:hypothetical protein Snas_0232 [Stackebrandtia nassauensis DSM 44728]
MRHPVGVNQPDDNGQPQPPDGFDPRQNPRGLMTDGRRVADPADFGRGPRGGDFPQTVFRNERPPVQRHHREQTTDEYEETARSMASHPLFRGLLQELPPRTAPPSQEWLDRWSSTARSILELLYSRDPLALDRRLASALNGVLTREGGRTDE